MNQEFIIKDDNGKVYHPKNLKKFKDHIIKYHTFRGEGDNSLHVEEGRFFTITKSFLKDLMKM